MINISPLLKVMGIVSAVLGVISGVLNIASGAEFIGYISFTIPLLVGAVLFYAFAELLESVNAIKDKLLGEVNQNKIDPPKIVHSNNIKQ